MEDSVIVIISLALMACSLIGIKMLRPIDNHKQAKKDVTDTAQKEVITSKDITITTLKDELRSVMGKLTRLRDKEPEEEEEELDNGVKPVTWDEITALVHTTYPKYDKILPFAKKQIMDMIKGMSMEEILNYVKQFTGNKESEGTPNPESIAYNPNWA